MVYSSSIWSFQLVETFSKIWSVVSVRRMELLDGKVTTAFGLWMLLHYSQPECLSELYNHALDTDLWMLWGSTNKFLRNKRKPSPKFSLGHQKIVIKQFCKILPESWNLRNHLPLLYTEIVLSTCILHHHQFCHHFQNNTQQNTHNIRVTSCTHCITCLVTSSVLLTCY